MFKDPRFLTGLIAAGGVVATAYWLARRRRLTPEQREQVRRQSVNQSRRWIEGEIVEADETSVYYTYEFRGVAYAASQDVQTIVHMLPENPAKLAGRQVTVKFHPANPANSIVVCEEWSGLPGAPRGQRSHSEREA